MAEERTPTEFKEPRSDTPMQEVEALDNAIGEARVQLDAMTQAASSADAATGGDPRCSLHEVPGVGRYAIPYQGGWAPLIELVNDKQIDIDFSLSLYPVFDAVVDQHFNGAQLSDPLDDDYESFKNLRDNISAVRNFLMQTYYANTPNGMTPDKAKAALEQIATFVGNGLHNNYLFLKAIPNHNPTKPFINLDEANKPGGVGAQYIYEKILEMQRHNNWMRPFAPIVSLFGGKANADWMLLPADATPFRDHYASELLPPTMSQPPTKEEIAAQQRYLEQLQARRAQMSQSAALTMLAVDIDSIGNHLLYTSDNINGMAHVSEPVKREAIDIAKDILRKLKLALGNLNIIDGLKLKPQDDIATLGAIKGVVMVYERLFAWARGIDPTIMQHPSVMAANRAIGQLGYLSKLEAYRIAKAAGNGPLADKLKGQLSRIPPYFSEATDAHFGSLLDKVERGIDTVMNRVQEVNGPNAMVGHKPSKDISSFMSATPIAGQSMLVSSDASSNRSKQQAAMIEAQNMVEQAQASRIQSQIAQRQQQQTGQTQQAARAPGRGRQQLQQAQRQQASSATVPTQIATGVMTQAQRQQAQRSAFMAAQTRDHHDEHDHFHSPQEIARQIDARVLQSIRNATNTANLNTTPVTTNRAAYEQQARATAARAQQQTTTQPKAMTDAERARQQQQLAAAQQPPGGPKGGRGGSGGMSF